MSAFADSAEALVTKLTDEGKDLENSITEFLKLVGEDGTELIDVLKLLETFIREFEVS